MRKQKTVNVQFQKKIQQCLYIKMVIFQSNHSSFVCLMFKCFKFQSDIYLGKAEVADGGDGGLSGK